MPKYMKINAIPNEQRTPTFFLPTEINREKFNSQNRERYSNNFHQLRLALMDSFIEEHNPIKKHKSSTNNTTIASERITSPTPIKHSFDLIDRYIERLTSENTSAIPNISGSKHITDDNLIGLKEDNLNCLKKEGLVSETGHPTQKGITTIIIFELEWIFRLHMSYIFNANKNIPADDSEHASQSGPIITTTDRITHQLKISRLMYQFCSSRINSTFNPDVSNLENRMLEIVASCKKMAEKFEGSTLPDQPSVLIYRHYNVTMISELVNLLKWQLAFLEVGLLQNKMELTSEKTRRIRKQFKYIKTIFEENLIPVEYTKDMQDNNVLMREALGLVTQIIENLNNKKQHGILTEHASLLIKAYSKMLINSLENITSHHLFLMGKEIEFSIIDFAYSDHNSKTHNKSVKLDNEMFFVRSVIDLCIRMKIDIASIQYSISSFMDGDNFIDRILKDNKVSSQTTSGTNPLYSQLYCFYTQLQKKMNDNCASENENLSPRNSDTGQFFREENLNSNGKRSRSSCPGAV